MSAKSKGLVGLSAMDKAEEKIKVKAAIVLSSRWSTPAANNAERRNDADF